MRGLLTYSGISTKVRAMESRQISGDQYREMSALGSVVEALEYLKRLPAYQDIFSAAEELLHRGTIEQKLTLSLYQDYAKLYRFATIKQRRFLDFYFMHFEIDIIKRCLRNSMAHNQIPLELAVFQTFFEKHSRLDIMKLSASENLEEFISNLKGSVYYDVLSGLEGDEENAQFRYETALDLLYFSRIWKAKDKVLSPSERQNFAKCFGSKIDLLNLQWIYRSKRYYNIPQDTLKRLLVPFGYKLKRDQLTGLAEAATLDEFYATLAPTYYGTRLSPAELDTVPDLELFYRELLDHIYTMASRKAPYSSAILNTYLYNKEAELHRIITIVESIRYQVSLEYR